MQRPSGKRIAVRGVATLLALATAQAARATDTVTVSGATLFESFFLSPSSTNDFIDVNGNTISGFNGSGTPYVEQLAPVATFANNGATVTYQASDPDLTRSPVWNLYYRELGSVNGLQELLNSNANVANPWIPVSQVSKAFVNTTTVVNGGIASFSSSNTFSGLPSAITSTGADIAVLDVPSKWGLQAAGTAAWNLKPTQAGYGTNTSVSSTGYFNMLVNRTVNSITFNNNTGSPDAHTLFDTAVAIAPINIIANPGIGTDQIKATELQQLFVTGRLPTGENLMAVTRSVGSGTRNGAMNSLGIDPSFASGENLGNQATGVAVTNLGATYQPGNYDGSGDMESGIVNTRLGIGYDGSDRATSRSGGSWGSMKVMMDTQGGTTYVTSSVSSIVDNASVNSGWRIGGLESFVTVGDPNAAFNSNPSMNSATAATYLRNITQSIAAYGGAPTSSSNYFMPADFLSASYLLQAGAQYVQNSTDATFWAPNPSLNNDVHDQAILNGTFSAKLVSSGSVGAGKVPTRGATVIPYSDGSTTGAYTYYDNTGAAFTVNGGTTLNVRNKIAGDFNNSGVRNINQISEMMSAVFNPVAWGQAHHSGATGSGLGTAAIAQILGDFNGDGNFDSKDVRYFADGLALRAANGVNNSTDSAYNDIGHLAGNLDRRAGFRAVDDAYATVLGAATANYFGTVIPTGKPYQSGDSRGDIAGATPTTPGAAPVGADLVVNALDINYAWSQVHGAMGTGTSGAFTTLLTRAITDSSVNVRADLSADMNGDLKLDADDITELVVGILGTQFGDLNLDGKVTSPDFTIMASHWNSLSGETWATGDLNGDGKVTSPDFTSMAAHWDFQRGAPLMPSGIGTSPAPTPEPGSLALLTLGGLLALRRRRNT